MILKLAKLTVSVEFVKNVCGLNVISNSIFCLCMAHVGKYGLLGLLESYSSPSYFLEKKSGIGMNSFDSFVTNPALFTDDVPSAKNLFTKYRLVRFSDASRYNSSYMIPQSS